MSNEELELTFMQDIRALESSGRKLPLELTPMHAWRLFELLLRALRHAPSGSGEALYGVELARNIESRLCKSPAMQEVARRLWAAPSPEPEPKLHARVATTKKKATKR